MSRIRQFYSGAFYYGLAYTAFISLEFAIHDALIEQINEFTGQKEKSILYFLKIIDAPPGSTGPSWHNEMISSFIAGYLGAFLTNGIETVAVNK